MMHRFEENLYLGKEGRNICKILGMCTICRNDAAASKNQLDIAPFYLPNDTPYTHIYILHVVCRNTIFLREHDH